MNPIVYNNELWNTFFTFTENYSQDLPEEQKINATQTSDMLRAISSYRAYPCKKRLLEAVPELAGQEIYIDMLWGHFQGLTIEQLSDLAIESILDTPTG